MRKMIGFALATAVAFAASVASAQNVQGTIEEIDPVGKSIVVDGKVYQMPDEMTAGTPLEELKVGDKVDITVNEEDRGDDESRARAMMVNKVEE
jgi:hypothetical protein